MKKLFFILICLLFAVQVQAATLTHEDAYAPEAVIVTGGTIDGATTGRDVITATHTYYVDGNRADTYTADGGASRPYKTVLAALTVINADAAAHATAGHYELTNYVLKVAPGTYTDNLTITNEKYLRIEGAGVEISGTIAITQTQQTGDYYSRLEFVGGEGTRTEKGPAFKLSGAITATRNNDSLTYITTKGVWISGNVLFDTDGTFVWNLDGCRVAGTVSTGTFSDADSAVLIETTGWNEFAGAISGKVSFYTVDNVEFYGAIDITPIFDCRLTNSRFGSTVSIVATKNLSVDTVSLKAIVDRTPTLTGMTIVYLDQVANGTYKGIIDTAAPGDIGEDTPGAGTFTTLTTTGDTNIGSTTAGKNLTVNTTRTSIFTFDEANVNEDDATWTMTGTGPLVHVTGNTTTLTLTTTQSIEIGKRYCVTITGTSGTTTATYTLGGVSGTRLAASGAIAIEDFITASTTGALIITPGNTCTVSITSITIEKLTDATGDLTVDGNIVARSPIILGYSDGLGITNINKSTGISISSGDTLEFYSTGVKRGYISTFTGYWNILSGIALGSGGDVILQREAADTLGIYRTTNQQKVDIFNTTDAGLANYERMAITGVQGASVNITAETAGTGGDNLDVVLTPAGTGAVRVGNVYPIADDTYYLGKPDDDTPFAFKGLVLKDTTNGKYYNIVVTNGAIVVTDLTD